MLLIIYISKPVNYLCQFTGVEPYTVAYVADIDFNVLVVGFHQCAVILQRFAHAPRRAFRSESPPAAPQAR